MSREHDYFWSSGGYIVESLVNEVRQKGNVDIDDSPIDPPLIFQHLYRIVWHNKVLVVMDTADRHMHGLADIH